MSALEQHLAEHALLGKYAWGWSCSCGRKYWGTSMRHAEVVKDHYSHVASTWRKGLVPEWFTRRHVEQVMAERDEALAAIERVRAAIDQASTGKPKAPTVGSLLGAEAAAAMTAGFKRLAAQDRLIEKVAQVLHKSGRYGQKNEWDDLEPEDREFFLAKAKALHRAGLLDGGDQS